MEYLNSFKRSITQELNQNDVSKCFSFKNAQIKWEFLQILQRNLLVAILTSRRLLSDHLDILEEALGDCSKKYQNASEKLTLTKTTGIMATSYAAFACILSR